MKTETTLTLLLALAQSAANAVPIIDQSNLDRLPGSSRLMSDLRGTLQHGQTFTVGVTGKLVELDLVGTNGLGAPGFLVDIRGQIKHSHNYPHPDDSVVLQTVSVGGFAPAGYTQVSLNIDVTAGQLLSFVVYGYGGRGAELIGTAFVNSNGGYADGMLWTYGDPNFGLDGPGTWYPNGATGNIYDFVFRTLVEPSVQEVPDTGSAMGLLGLGVATLLVYRRKRRFDPPKAI